MKSNDLFSHLPEAEDVSDQHDPAEPVQNPVFSDGPKRATPLAAR
ncbi:hypothetical protein [Mycolicibacterium sp. XJ1819]